MPLGSQTCGSGDSGWARSALTVNEMVAAWASPCQGNVELAVPQMSRLDHYGVDS